VVAQVECVQPRRHHGRVEIADRHARLAQPLRRGMQREAAAHVVDQDAHRHSALVRADQRIDEVRADAVSVKDIRRERDGSACFVDRLQHRRIGLGAVDQRLDRIAWQERPLDHFADQASERHELADRQALVRPRGRAHADQVAAQACGAPLHPVHAEEDVQDPAEDRQQPREQHPERGRARIALVDDCVAGREQGHGERHDAKDKVEGTAQPPKSRTKSGRLLRTSEVGGKERGLHRDVAADILERNAHRYKPLTA
jgi:hypothetical protein